MKNQILVILLATFSIGVFAQTQKINTKKSSIEWTGKKIGGQHQGFIQITKGSLSLKNDQLIAGEFTIDMNSITNTDLENESYNQKLIGHLKSDDFFGVSNFPTASFKLVKSTKFVEGKATVTGEITIKGITQSINFNVERKGNTYSGKIEVDRSKFNVKYGSTSFFDSLGDKAIDDIFILDVKLIIE